MTDLEKIIPLLKEQMEKYATDPRDVHFSKQNMLDIEVIGKRRILPLPDMRGAFHKICDDLGIIDREYREVMWDRLILNP